MGRSKLHFGRIIRLDSARQHCAIRPNFGQTSVLFGVVILSRIVARTTSCSHRNFANRKLLPASYNLQFCTS